MRCLRLLAPLCFACATLVWQGVSRGTAGQIRKAALSQRSGAQLGDSSAVIQVVNQFNKALVAGDSAAAAGLLAPNATILEGGERETRLQYLSHHFHSDHAFLSALSQERKTRRVCLAGNVAWVTTTGRLRGTYEGETYDLNMAGLIVLRWREGRWRIQAIHWSSRSRE